MRKQILIIVLLAIGYISQAQVQENLLMERFNMNAFNPAYVGSEGREVSFTTRSTWQGVVDAPRTSYFFYSGNPKKNLSLGGSVISNKVYIDTRTQYAVDASYQLEMGGGSPESPVFSGFLFFSCLQSCLFYIFNMFMNKVFSNYL